MAKIDSKKEAPKGKAKSEATGTEGPAGVSIRVDKEKYNPARTASGTKSLNNGDPVALALAGLTLGEVQSLADSFIGENDFRKRYAKLNPGMQRMNIGNRLRGAINKATVTDAEGKVTTDGNKKFDKAAAPFIKTAKARDAEAAKVTKDKAAAARDAEAKKATDTKAKEKAAKDKESKKAA